jgi:glucose-1-phosphate cytidylyltransferase
VYNFGQNKGVLEFENYRFQAFREKSDMDGDVIYIGFMVFEPVFFDYIEW